MTTSKKGEFAKNTLILMLGKICTQFISFFLIPIYTRRLNTADYGTIDLIQTYISLLAPLLILRLDSAIFRFLIDERKNDDKKNKQTIISNSIATISIISLLFLGIYLIIPLFVTVKYYWLIYFNIISIMFSNIFLQITRGLGYTKHYSIASVITGVSIAVTNLTLILGFNFGAESILVASIIGNVFCSVYLSIIIKSPEYIHHKHLNKKQLKTMLQYSLPMIPNSLSWWIVNVSDRTIISIILGVAMNGIYTISCKFSNVINSIFSIFNMSWQESASLHIDDIDKDEYFTKMSNGLFIFFSYIVALLLCVLPIIFDIVVGKDYRESFNYIPILLIANIFHIAIQIIGGIYVALKKTKKIMITTIISSVINLAINLILIKFIGIYAACISTLAAYAIMASVRYIDIKKYINLKLDKKNISLITFVLCASIFAFYQQNNYISILLTLLIILLFVTINKNTVIDIAKSIKIKKQKDNP